MKHSDTEPDTQTGKFVTGAKGMGTVTKGMVIRRAKEIAVANGRNGNDYRQDDYDQARRELVGFSDEEETLENSNEPSTGAWLGPAGDTGKKTPVRGAADEQQLGEKLVREGKNEAAHHQMVAGNQESANE